MAAARVLENSHSLVEVEEDGPVSRNPDGVSEAWFDRSEQTLHVAFAPGPLGLLQNTFAVTGFDPRVPVELLHEGDPATTLKPGSASGRAARSADGTVRVEFDPRKAASFALKSMS